MFILTQNRKSRLTQGGKPVLTWAFDMNVSSNALETLNIFLMTSLIPKRKGIHEENWKSTELYPQFKHKQTNTAHREGDSKVS